MRLAAVLAILAFAACLGMTMPPIHRFALSVLAGVAVGRWLFPLLRGDSSDNK
jgi:hypothetical protein